jgi:hypothetical protein
MRTVTPLLTTGLAVALTLTIAGCFGDTTTYTPVAEPTAAPLFASDEEALAAAEEAYRDFLGMSDQILNEGGVDGDRIYQAASSALAALEIEGYEEAKLQGLKTTGSSSFEKAVLQQYDSRSNSGVEIVSIYVCTDRSGVDVVDSRGESIVNPARQDRKPHEVFFDHNESTSSQLIVSSVEEWTGTSTCS